jgi:polyhydroxyalkanoate synthesis regulator phasin
VSAVSSPWTARIGWCIFLLGGAALVTSGFEVPPAIEAEPSRDVMTTGGVAAEAVSPRHTEQPENTGTRSRAIQELTIQELKSRIDALEKRLAEQSTAVTSSPAEGSARPLAAAPSLDRPRVSQEPPAESDQTPVDGLSERDLEIERVTGERAQKMVSEMREQMKQLEVERARQMQELIDSSR